MSPTQLRLSRRGALLGALSACGCARAASAQNSPDRRDLTASPPVALTAAERERHGIFLLAAMALLHNSWGVDQSAPGQRAAYAEIAREWRFTDYLGHNIGALLVDRNGGIICFALNRNVALNSTMAHAEARAVGAAIVRANAASSQGAAPSWSFGALLRGDTLYGTLEPCAQCAGIMELAGIFGRLRLCPGRSGNARDRGRSLSSERPPRRTGRAGAHPRHVSADLEGAGRGLSTLSLRPAAGRPDRADLVSANRRGVPRL